MHGSRVWTDRVADQVCEAESATSPGDRYRAGMLAARLGATMLLGSGPDGPAGQRPLAADPGSPGPGRPGNVELWARLARRVPRFAEWASYFAVLERGRLSSRQVDDLVRDVPAFLQLVDRYLADRQHTSSSS